ncbi:DUF6247 family protein [Umezawaea sp. Da 62-37]|uniref:DUF6247 family protein n=1 Tax=Umezawaea sp. Da 62-37 TaxID=3075927 RepID=UPI0028F72AC3|nr:DUF6247 family protein [Umezawaea sp. Da 62-37]WNV86646.1 DUF6247 family protein [Umezawaea sp. Da 62-37]WNV86771.1 DUF6247 family protein [Umezawaea sp. Da 62-37]
MTAAGAHDPAPEVAKTPEAIRAALLPEERAQFDESCRWAVGHAAAEQSLAPVHEVLDQWHLIARVTRHDPAAHRRMLERIAETIRTGEVSGRVRTWDEIQAGRGAGRMPERR